MLYKNLNKVILFILIAMSASTNLVAGWVQITNIPPPYDQGSYLEVTFLKSNPKFGWICGFNSYVLRTTDYGNTWQGTVVGNADQLESINFVDSLHGYTSGSGQIYKSIDGGATWENITSFNMFGVLIWGNYFLTPDIGMVIGDGCGADPQHYFRTTDGGATWADIQSFVPDAGLTDLILYSANGLGYASGSGRIFRTLDGGRSWNFFSTTGSSAWQEELTISGNTILVPTSEGCNGSKDGGGWRISTDLGKNWRSTNFNFPFYGAFLIDSLHGWVCGWDRSVIHSNDGFITWTNDNCGIPDKVNLDDIFFLNDTTGWVVGYGVFKYTRYSHIKPEVDILGKTSLCEGDSVILNVKSNYKYYTWSNGSKDKSIVVRNSGVYTVICNNNPCDSAIADSVHITFNPAPNPKIIATKTVLCDGDTAMLYTDTKYRVGSFVWSNNKYTDTIFVTQSGTYKLYVVNDYGCTGEDEVTITFKPLPKPTINTVTKTTICYGDSVFLETQPGYKEYQWYNIDDSSFTITGTNKIYVKESGKYYVRVKDNIPCEGLSEITTINVILDSNKLEITSEPGSSYLNFDSVNIGSIFCKKVSLRNKGAVAFTITDAYIRKNLNFSLPQSQFSIILQPNEKIELEICFSPSSLGTFRDTLEIHDICYTQLIPLIGISKIEYTNGTSECDVKIITKIRRANKVTYAFHPPQPNPSSDKLTIPFTFNTSGDDKPSIQCQLFNSFGMPANLSDGEMLIHYSTDQNGKCSITIDTKSISSGVYIAKIIADSGFVTYQFVITK